MLAWLNKWVQSLLHASSCLLMLVLFCSSIVDGICAVTGDGECVIVFQQHDLQVAYLPNPHGYACDLFNNLCTR